MAKQLWVVEIVQELVVVAEDRDEAVKLGLKAAKEDPHDGGEPGVSASEMMYYPGDWEDDNIPYGYSDPADPDRSLGKWIDMGAAPKLKRV